MAISEAQRAFAKLARRVREEATKCRDESRANYPFKNWLAHREVEIIPTSSRGERAADPVYINLGDVTGLKLMMLVKDALRGAPSATGVSVEGALDLYESFNDYVNRAKGFDYEPRVESWNVDVPGELLEMVRA